MVQRPGLMLVVGWILSNVKMQLVARWEEIGIVSKWKKAELGVVD